MEQIDTLEMILRGRMMKVKFDKRKCLKCKYHGTRFGNFVQVKKNEKEMGMRIHCNYSATGETALKMVDGKLVDTRGDDYKHCLLYEKGTPQEVENDITTEN